MGKEKTKYGWKKPGESKFVIVAPHGAGDDKLTDKIAEQLAEQLGASVVVNTEMRRSEADFNDISDIAENEDKRGFFEDIGDYADEARGHSTRGHNGEEHALVIYIHGMKDREDTGIDIGIGAKWNKKKKKYQGARYHPESGEKKGKVRANISMTREMRIALDEKLKVEKNKRARIGKVFAAWDENNGIQYHAGTEDHSMQIEISKELREDPEYIAKVIAGALEESYKEL